MHINLWSSRQFFLALLSFWKDETNVAVLVRPDNHTAIAYLNKLGNPMGSQVLPVSWEWCLLHQFSLHTEYLAGKDTVGRPGILSP